MQPIDREEYISRYEARLQQHGYSPKTLGWGKHGRQRIRFSVLAEFAIHSTECTVLDVGCGFADLYDYMLENGWRGQYKGIDIVASLLEIAKKRHPELNLQELDITDPEVTLGQYDFVIASGIFNAKLIGQDNLSHIENALKIMFQTARVAVCVDFMTTHVDFQQPGSWHTDPAWALTLARQLSRRILLRQDYMPFEFSLILFKDDSATDRNVFKAFEDNLA